MRKRKSEITYWERRIKDMFESVPDSNLVENRYRALRFLLKPKYPQLMDIPQETLIEILRDAVYLDRKLRKETEGQQVEEKKILEDEWLVENEYISDPKLPI